jgi:hypothetical protein
MTLQRYHRSGDCTIITPLTIANAALELAAVEVTADPLVHCAGDIPSGLVHLQHTLHGPATTVLGVEERRGWENNKCDEISLIQQV